MRKIFARTGVAVLLALTGAVAASGAPAHAASLCDRPEPPPSCNGGGGEDPDPGPVDTAPRGAFDTMTFVGNGVHVTGWAADIDTGGPLLVDIYVDGAFTRTLTANTYRPDVAAVYPYFGAYRGYDAFVPSGHGAHTVCAWVINVAPAGATPLPNRQLGCKSYDVPAVANIKSSYANGQWTIAFDDNVVGETGFQVRWDYYVLSTIPGTHQQWPSYRYLTYTLPAHAGTGRVSVPAPYGRPANTTKLTVTAPGSGSASTTDVY
ncbi:hypothetical protein GCM10010399_88520 [Dactylosporangium fulvum]|uniref:Uncharacterized protein n=1 Tax=Dactylosporangium fulvum TaxID=53359 RepID=A0ABY5WAF3_9ACTN|nr:hypothetical protein [Dactylosporangium fulvum]UWP87038.1 hypothetical protein Dfulv_23465 [Dactylosporangium fulvum]